MRYDKKNEEMPIFKFKKFRTFQLLRQSKVDYPIKVQSQKLELDDRMLQIGDLMMS